MSYYKKLIGKRVYLSPMDINDIERLTSWMNDLEITNNIMTSHRILSLEKEREWLQLEQANNLAIVNKSNDQLIGVCGF